MLLGTDLPAGPVARGPTRTAPRRAAPRALTVLYRPRLDLRTETVLGCEAVPRPRDRGPLGRRGLADPTLVLAQACVDAREWGGRQVSVSVSAGQLASGTLPAQVAAALERSGLAPEQLELDVAESPALAGDTEALLTLSALRDLGAGIALGEFGRAWAGIALLRRLPLTALKLDAALTRELPASREDAAIVRATIHAAGALGLRVVAAGIETETQRACLAGLGCDEGEGALFSPPLPAALVGPFLAYRDETCPARRSGPETAHGHPFRAAPGP